MNILAFRMEAYRLAFEFIRLGHGCTLAQTEEPRSVRDTVERCHVDLFVIGYLRNRNRDSFEVLKQFHRDPVLRKMPAAVVIGMGEGAVSQFRFQQAKKAFQCSLLPIFYPSDLVPQYLHAALGEHAKGLRVPRPPPPMAMPFQTDVFVRNGTLQFGFEDDEKSIAA